MCTSVIQVAGSWPPRHAGGRCATSIESHHVSRRNSFMSHANQTSMTRAQNRVAPPFLFLPPLFLSSFLLLSSPCGGSIGNFEFYPQI
jgi:hypothetical protein